MSDDDPDRHGGREAGDVDRNGNGADHRSRPGARRSGTAAVVVVIGWAVAVGVLGWIDPLLVILLGLVVGIGWLLRTDADPVHWGPVPREGRRFGSSRPFEGPSSSGVREGAPASVVSPGVRRRP